MALSNLFNTGTPQPVTATPQPPSVAPQAPAYMQNTLPSQSFNMPQLTSPGSTPTPLDGVDYNNRLSGSLDHFMNPNSALIQQARQRGMEVAATRGGVNSSIAAGAAERAALDSAVPLAQASAGMQAGVDQVKLQDWAATQGFNRELYSMPFTSSMGMLQRVTDMSLQDPELYSPSVVSGYTNFFNQQMGDMMRRYFGGG